MEAEGCPDFCGAEFFAIVSAPLDGVVLEPGVQVQLLDRKRWRTRVELANAIFDYLEIFHSRQRRHSSLGILTPVELQAHRRPMAAA